MSDASGVSIESLRRLAQGLLHDPHRAEDVVQEAWLAALRRDVEARSLGAWLHGAVRRIARGKVREEQRRRARERHAARDEVVAGGADVAARIEVLRKLLDAVETLDDPSRTVISMRFFDDLPPREIARRLDVPVDTVRTRIRRALATLRRELDPGDADARERFLCALAPLAGLPIATAPIVSTATTLELATPVFLMKNKLALVTVIVAALFAITVAIGLLPRRGAEEGTQPVVETAAVETRTSETPHVAHVETEPASRTVATSITAPRDWIVRGFVVRNTYEPVPGANLVGRVRAGTHTSGEILLEERFVADEHGEFAWALEAPSRALTLQVEVVGSDRNVPSYPRHVFPGDAAPENWRVAVLALDRTVHGNVRDLSGKAVAGAQISHGNYGAETLTNEHGAYRLLITSLWQETPLTILAPGFASTRVTLGLLPQGDHELDDVVLQPETRLRGRVVDESSQPIAGAAVRVRSVVAANSTTDEDGRFEVAGLGAELEDAVMSVECAGYAPATFFDLEHESGELFELQLTRAVTLNGTVRSPEGLPVEGAWVAFQYHGRRIDGGGRGVRTDVDGRFSLEGARSGEQHLWVERTGFIHDHHAIDIPEGAVEVNGIELVLERGAFLGGVVVDEHDAPIPYASVSARRAVYITGGDPQLHTYADRHGRFRFEDLARAQMRLTVLARGHARDEQRVSELDRDDLILRPPPAAAIAGRVLDGDTGVPITNFVLKVQPDPNAAWFELPGSWKEGVHIRDAENGAWRLSSAFAPDERCRVEVQAPGYAPTLVDSVATALEPDPDALVLRLVRATHVRGVVVDRDGIPLGGIRVRSLRDPSELRTSDYATEGTETDSFGRFEFRDVRTGETRLAVDSDAHAVHLDGPFEVTGPAVVERHIVLESGASLRGRLLDAEGNGRAGQIVSASGLEIVGRERDWETTTNADGAYVIERLPEGLYHVRWVRELGDQRCFDLVDLVRLRANESHSLDLRPKGRATVRGRVEWAGELTRTTRVSVIPRHERTPEDGPGVIYARSSRGAFVEDGSFEFEGVAAGIHAVIVSSDPLTGRRLSGSANIEVPAEGVVDVVVQLKER